MSQEGYDELVAELEHLEKVELPAVRDASLRLATRAT